MRPGSRLDTLLPMLFGGFRGSRALAVNKLIRVPDAFSSDAFYASAQEFAVSTLEAHHAGNRRRVPIDSGTALEHLAKACLASRSLALLAELRGDSSVTSLIGLLGIEGAPASSVNRTVGLTEALNRAGRFVKSNAAKPDLQALTDIRNGIVHAAEEAAGRWACTQ